MVAVLISPKVDAEPRRYMYEGQLYMTVSGEAMGYIEAAREVCGSNDHSEALKLAIDAAETAEDYAVLRNLYVYARFEHDIHPGELRTLFGDSVHRQLVSLGDISSICTKAGKYWANRGKHRKDTLTRK